MRIRRSPLIFMACLMLVACDSSTGPVLAPVPEGAAADASKAASKTGVIKPGGQMKVQVSPD